MRYGLLGLLLQLVLLPLHTAGSRCFSCQRGTRTPLGQNRVCINSKVIRKLSTGLQQTLCKFQPAPTPLHWHTSQAAARMFVRLPAAQLLGRLVGSGAVQSCRGFAEVPLAKLGPNAYMTDVAGSAGCHAIRTLRHSM